MVEDVIYGEHPEIAGMARAEFAEHRMRRGPGYSWRLAKSGTGNYSFRVTWVPGAVMVSGDIGHAAYEVWPSFGGLWEAVDLIAGAGCDYLTGKSGIRKEFDREGTVKSVLTVADGQMREARDFDLWEKIADRYGWHTESARNAAHQMKMAARFREDIDLDPGEIWRWLGNDAELIRYRDPVSARWHYEAVSLWARMMLADEPRWHLAWRRSRAEWKRLKGLRKHVFYRPDVVRLEQWLNGSQAWTRRGNRWCAVYPLKVFSVDLSRCGFWAAGGSSMPADSRSAAIFERAA
jgi:hypothetical protein